MYLTENELSTVQNVFDNISKICIESSAATAYNEVIFEAALSDEILSEADDEKKKGSEFVTGIKNTAFKAIETLKMFVKTIFNKIRVAINQTIETISEKNAQKAIDKAMSNEVKSVTVNKDYFISNPDNLFLRDISSKFDALVRNEKEEDIATDIAKSISSGLGNNYNEAKKALEKVSKVSDVTKVISNIASYVKEDDTYRVAKFVEDSQVKKVVAASKREYSNSLNTANKFIKEREKDLKSSLDDDKIAEIKREVLNAEKLISVIHAGFIGYLKWTVACNNILIKNIKSGIKDKKKEAKNEAAFTEFMGLQLL